MATRASPSTFNSNEQLFLSVIPLFESKAREAVNIVTQNSAKNQYENLSIELKLLRSNLETIARNYLDEQAERPYSDHLSDVLTYLDKLVNQDRLNLPSPSRKAGTVSWASTDFPSS